MPRVVILGCGTGAGKTRLSVALLRELGRRGQSTVGLKPIESGITAGAADALPMHSDAAALAQAGTLQLLRSHPLYALRDPVSPHLAARRQDQTIELERVRDWVARAELQMTPQIASDRANWSVLETAGGAFSPLSDRADNFELARALEPAIWVLVAADALGVLHEVSATLQAMRARGRAPDHLVLSAAREPDASTGSNADELTSLGIITPSAVLARDDDRDVRRLVAHLLAAAR